MKSGKKRDGKGCGMRNVDVPQLGMRNGRVKLCDVEGEYAQNHRGSR